MTAASMGSKCSLLLLAAPSDSHQSVRSRPARELAHSHAWRACTPGTHFTVATSHCCNIAAKSAYTDERPVRSTMSGHLPSSSFVVQGMHGTTRNGGQPASFCHIPMPQCVISRPSAPPPVRRQCSSPTIRVCTHIH